METKYTKGKFYFESDENGTFIWSGNKIISQMMDESIDIDGCNINETIPNAKLIVAAPEMYDKLVEIVTFLEYNYDHDSTAMEHCDEIDKLLNKIN